jgi:hypothetical protein
VTVFALRLSRAACVMLAAAATALGGAACGRDLTALGAGGRAVLAFRGPLFQSVATSGGVSSDVTGIRVVITAFTGSATAGRVIVNTTPEVDTLGVNNDDEDQVSFVVEFPIQGGDATYQLVVRAANASGDTLYQAGPVSFSSGDISAAGSVTVQSTVTYVGPGANATRVVVSPKSVSLVAFSSANSAQLAATAYDASGNVVPRALIQWEALDTTVVGVDGQTGQLFALNKRGTTKVVGGIPTGPTDTAVVSVTLPASQFALVSGGGQRGASGHALPQPIVVKAEAMDGVAVPGTVVTFQATSGGSASPQSAIADANGNASTMWTLGSNSGAQTLNVNAVAVTSTQVAATDTTATGGSPGGATLTLLATSTASTRRGSGPTSP